MCKLLIKRFFLFAPLFFLLFSIVSCSSTQKVKYFQDIPDSGAVKVIPKADYIEPVIRSGDALYVFIQTLDPLSSSAINSGSISSAGPSSAAASLGALTAPTGGNMQAQSISGYVVDREGNIELPVIGKLKAAGYTTFQLKDTVNKLANKYYKDYTVVVRFANFKVSVTGEVLKPGDYIMPDERETVFDALAMAGDLTIFGKRENVLLVRENTDGSRTAYRLNLKKSDVMSSPVYYLRQNDLIYVEPRKAKSDATDAAQAKYVGIIGAILSVIIVLATRVR